MQLRKMILFAALSFTGVGAISTALQAGEVYSNMESEDQSVATGSGLIATTPNETTPQPAQKALNKKALQHALPKQVKAGHAPREVAVRPAPTAPVAQAVPVSQVTRVAPHAAVPGIEIKVNRRETHAPLSTSEKGAYDAVPSDQVESLVRRLKLVEALITRHARAYDYRIHTIKELEGVLADLDRTLQPVQPAAAPAAPAEKTTARFPVEGQAAAEPVADPLPPPPAPIQQ